MGTAIKQPVPDRVKPSFVIFDTRALWRSGLSDAQGWASECPDVKNYKWRLNPVWYGLLYSCTHMATVGVKGSTARLGQVQYCVLCIHLWRSFVQEAVDCQVALVTSSCGEPAGELSYHISALTTSNSSQFTCVIDPLTDHYAGDTLLLLLFTRRNSVTFRSCDAVFTLEMHAACMLPQCEPGIAEHDVR